MLLYTYLYIKYQTNEKRSAICIQSGGVHSNTSNKKCSYARRFLRAVSVRMNTYIYIKILAGKDIYKKEKNKTRAAFIRDKAYLVIFR